MRARAAARPVRATAAKYAQTRFLAAEDFLNWAGARGLPPGDVTQADIDAYCTTSKTYQKQVYLRFGTPGGRAIGCPQ